MVRRIVQRRSGFATQALSSLADRPETNNLSANSCKLHSREVSVLAHDSFIFGRLHIRRT